ncbi:MAG: Hpt domain-containing protein [Sulfuriflexus sp.]|nr:Hpt domain-containing protein [Sulfuriflexus sp.]
MSDSYDYSTLNWVKGEIDETLDQARQALEAYVENTDDEAQLQFCVNHIHQVHGTLKMVELYGAVMIAEEMENLAVAVQEKKITKKEDAYDILMRAILQLPDYLEHLQSGQQDVPLALLPLLNDMRAICGQSLLSESAFFSPDLSVDIPEVAEPKKQQDISALAKKLRHHYQMGLVSWFRDRDVERALTQIISVVSKLRQAAKQKPVAQLLWVAEGVIEALIDDGLTPSVSSKLLLGQVDREIKKLIDGGEQAIIDEPPIELIKNLLYYVATATSGGDKVQELSAAFKLDGLLSGGADEESKDGLSAVNTEVMETVTSAVKEDIARIKDEIDIYIRTSQQDTGSLVSVQDALKKVADTLGMIGLGTQRNVVVEQAEVIAAIIDGRVDANDDTFMEMASGFLFIESSLSELGGESSAGEAHGNVVLEGLKRLQDGSSPEPLEPASGFLQDNEQRELLKVVIKEAKADMSRVKDAIISFVTAPWEHELLSEVPQLNRQVRGSMSMLSLNHAAELLSACNEYICKDLIEKKDIPDQSTLENLADVITSIEYYLEALDEERSDRDAILDIARSRVAKLGYPVADYDADAEQVETPKVDDSVPVVADEIIEVSVVEESVKEVVVDEVVEKPVVEEQVEEAPVETKVTPASNDVKEAGNNSAAAVLADDDNDIDEEILEIFFEEADEEMEALAIQFPKWKANHDDEEALSIVRRSFHTLKGSGRMVGATDIGEFAWDFENVLNRVIDRTIPMNADVIGLIEKALNALPHVIAKFKGEPADDVDVEALKNESHQLSKSGRLSRLESGEMEVPSEGEGPSVIASKESVAVTQLVAKEESTETEEPAGIDPVLLEIFTKESNRHLGDVHAFVEQCIGQDESCRINEDLIRAVHTLHGSSHMAGISDIAEVSSLMEKYVKLLNANNASVPEEVINLIKEFSAAISQRVGQLADDDANDDYKDDLLKKITQFYDKEIELLELSAGTLGGESAEEVVIPSIKGADLVLEEPEDDFDEELLGIFIEEAIEILDASEVTLQNWINQQDDKELVTQLQREIHTLKGGARMAAIEPMGDLSHSLETLIIAIDEGRIEISTSLFDVVQQAHDQLVVMLDQVKAKQPVDAKADLIVKLDLLTDGKKLEDLEVEAEVVADEPVAEESAPEIEAESKSVSSEASEPVVDDVIAEFPVAKQEQDEEEVIIMPEIPAQVAAVPEVEKQATGRLQHEQIRVRADLLDNLVNFAGEVSIYRSRIDQQVGAFGYNLTEMEQTISRVREQLRRFEIETETQIMYRFEGSEESSESFDPLEMDRFSNMQQLSRSLLESLNDLTSIQGLLETQTNEAETLLLQQSRINTELQEGLMRTRMVPFNTHTPRLRRLIRQTSGEVKKDIELVIVGEDDEMDRSVLDRVLPALEHMLRNSVDHGLETKAERKKTDKPKTGTILIDLKREGSEIVIRISDDGKGINLEAIREKARERGLMKDDSDLTDKEVLRFILESGFSTAEKVTQLSGRGVGMDVVNSEVKQLGGSLQIDTVEGKGTKFTVRLPLTLSVNKALLVHVGEDTYAIPLSSIDGVVRATHEELEDFYNSAEPRYQYGGNTYRFMHLGSQLALNQPILPGVGGKLPVLLARAGDHRIALQVEALMGSREIVVKSVGPQISTVRAISGATILSDGNVALILDVGALVYMDIAKPVIQTGDEKAAVEQAEVKNKITVMVVDDSITVRKVTTRLLERNNINVMTAKDGVDAVAVLQEQIPDLFLLDIEMPRMDGYELATHIRNDDVMKKIPIIMITSRTGDKHRQRAMDIGVDRYMGKPFQEADLLQNINEILDE